MPHMLESAGSSLDRIDKMSVVLAGAEDYDEMNRGGISSSRSTRPCALQLSNGHGVAIECIALAGNRPF